MGAPKAGTSALHAALAQHPQIYASPIKEPKYYMCWDAPPPAYRGPGDAHSNQEWIWRREEYQALFHRAPEQSVRLESTPFYLYMPGARRRIAEELPEAKLIIIVRDPIDVIAVTRHNTSLDLGNHHHAAERENFFLRGFNYLFLARKR